MIYSDPVCQHAVKYLKKVEDNEKQKNIITVEYSLGGLTVIQFKLCYLLLADGIIVKFSVLSEEVQIIL